MYVYVRYTYICISCAVYIVFKDIKAGNAIGLQAPSEPSKPALKQTRHKPPGLCPLGQMMTRSAPPASVGLVVGNIIVVLSEASKGSGQLLPSSRWHWHCMQCSAYLFGP